MTMTINNEIHQRGQFNRVALVADTADILPGHIVEETATGCQLNSVAATAGFSECMIAQVNRLQGTDKETLYPIGEEVQINVEQRGNLSQVRLKAGFNYTKGLKVYRTGDGTARPATGTPKDLFGTVVVAIDLTYTDAPDSLGCVRIA